MRTAFCVLCVAISSGIAGAQDQQPSNFDACVSEARQKHSDAAMPTYLSFKCDGATAQRLAARPDQCEADGQPLLRNIERRSRQLDDGLYLRIVWRTEVCAGLCETRVYNDARETSYSCEVRRHLEGPVAQYSPQPRNLRDYQRYGESQPPPGPVVYRNPGDYGEHRPRQGPGVYLHAYERQPPQNPLAYEYAPPVREYGQRAPYIYTRRPPGFPVERRITERYIYYIPGRYVEYRYPDQVYPYPDQYDDFRRYDSWGDRYRHGDSRWNDGGRADDKRDADGRIHYYYR